ncbi:MAG TPA: N-acetyl-gamma-glutamyl-phosphate reductase [Nitrospiria bacterium]|nr:N-acetyl-gamma-glutamyl-phosphate reductase [Nitrospiria bacterium]
MKKKIKIGIVGATGYTGGELLRILASHPEARVTVATSEQSSGKKVEELFPFLSGFYNLVLEKSDIPDLASRADLFFLALPHGKASAVAKALLENGRKVVDLSPDHRLADPEIYRKWYGVEPAPGALLKKAVYGLTEIYRDKIKNADLIANPGCYPTSILLPLYPLLKEGLIDEGFPLMIDAKSGVSGAGRSPEVKLLLGEVSEGIGPYKTGGTHRHIPEIEQEIEAFCGKPLKVTLTPHLLPIARGMLSVIYLKLKAGEKDLSSLYLKYYGNEPFIRILPNGDRVNPKNVRGSNLCHIGVSRDDRTGVTLLFGAIDNLVKGASGQAVQNMNLMLGLEETAGLEGAGVYP